MRSNERWRRREAIKDTIVRAMKERAGDLLVHNAARAQKIAEVAQDDLVGTILDGLLREYQIREKPRGSRVVPE